MQKCRARWLGICQPFSLSSAALLTEPHPGPKHKERPSIRRVPFAISVRLAGSRVAFASPASSWLKASSQHHRHDTCKQIQSQPQRGGNDGSPCASIAGSWAAKAAATSSGQQRLVSHHEEGSWTAPQASAKPHCFALHNLLRAQAARSSQSARRWYRTAWHSGAAIYARQCVT